jgi:hypothetical protein
MSDKTLNIADPKYCLYSPIWPPEVTARGLKFERVKFTDAGREKRCPRCDEFWPADTEFYYSTPSKADGLSSWCKSCYLTWKQEKAAEKSSENSVSQRPVKTQSNNARITSWVGCVA